jgi:hypothetical protein
VIRLESLAGVGVFAVADALRFAAAPIFAAMALLTGFDGGGSSPWLCSSTHAASPLGGMAMMYGLMALVHTPPWLRAVSSPRPRR